MQIKSAGLPKRLPYISIEGYRIKIHNYKSWDYSKDYLRNMTPSGVCHIVYWVYRFTKNPVNKKGQHALIMVTYIMINYYTGVQSYYLREKHYSQYWRERLKHDSQSKNK
jgi:hypothetical protein